MPGYSSQVPLQPGDRLGVEVVGGLVEQQQVGRGEQQAAQGHAAALAAGEGRHVLVAGRHAQRVHRDLELALQVPGVEAVDLVLELAVLDEQPPPSRRAPSRPSRAPISSKRRSRPTCLGDALLDVAAHVLGGVEVGLLGQQPHGRAGRQDRPRPEKSAVEPGHDRAAASTCRPRSRPRTPIFAPGRNDSETLSSTTLSGGCTLRRRYMVKMYSSAMFPSVTKRPAAPTLKSPAALSSNGDDDDERTRQGPRDSPGRGQ